MRVITSALTQSHLTTGLQDFALGDLNSKHHIIHKWSVVEYIFLYVETFIFVFLNYITCQWVFRGPQVYDTFLHYHHVPGANKQYENRTRKMLRKTARRYRNVFEARAVN